MIKESFISFQLFTVNVVKMMVFLVLTLCRMVSLLQHFRGMCCHHLQSDWIWSSWMLKWLRRGSVSKFSFTRLEIYRIYILKLLVGKGTLYTGKYNNMLCHKCPT